MNTALLLDTAVWIFWRAMEVRDRSARSGQAPFQLGWKLCTNIISGLCPKKTCNWGLVTTEHLLQELPLGGSESDRGKKAVLSDMMIDLTKYKFNCAVYHQAAELDRRFETTSLPPFTNFRVLFTLWNPNLSLPQQQHAERQEHPDICMSPGCRSSQKWRLSRIEERKVHSRWE